MLVPHRRVGRVFPSSEVVIPCDVNVSVCHTYSSVTMHISTLREDGIVREFVGVVANTGGSPRIKSARGVRWPLGI